MVYDNRSLFSDHYLEARLPERVEWSEPVAEAFAAARALYEQKRAILPQLNEAQTEEEWIKPLLRDVLGWSFDVQTSTVFHGSYNRPDYALFTSEAAKSAAQASYGDEAAYYAHAAVVGDAKFWGRPLDRKVADARDRLTNANPSFQIVRYLVSSGVPWGILTNGREWRLYSTLARSRVDTYYAADLERILEQGTEDDFRRFFLFFRAAAFRPNPQTDRTFLDEVFEGSVEYGRELERQLKRLVFDEVFPLLAKGLIEWRRGERGIAEETEQSLGEVYAGTLRLLYRLLFLLHAEARALLPVEQRGGYYRYSLTRVKGRVAERLNRQDVLSAVSTDLWNDLDSLFRIIDRGEPALNVPRYNGGLFRQDNPQNRFLEEHRVADRWLYPALDALTRAGGTSFIDYKSLNVEQLGSIYEGLLEFQLRMAPEELAVVRSKGTEIVRPRAGAKQPLDTIAAGEPFLANDRGERKATGSYYTPGFIVRYIVEATLGPTLAEREIEFRALMAQITPKRARLAAVEGKLAADPGRADAATTRWSNERNTLHLELPPLERRAADALLGIRLCDPAMGSGHFLVYAVDWLTERLISILSEFPENPVSSELAAIRAQIVANLAGQGIDIDAERLKDTSLLKRMVMKRCIYGVDLNPMAVELAKLSLWLDSFTVGAPLSFLDHHLKTGNSLVGTTVDEVRGALEAKGAQFDVFGGPFAGLLQATELMRDVATTVDATFEEVAHSAERFAAFERQVRPYKRVLDLWVSRWFGNDGAEELLRSHGVQVLSAFRQHANPLVDRQQSTLEDAVLLERDLRIFHWELEFPEVFIDLARAAWKENPGFDAVIGNPPYVRQEAVSALKPYFADAFGNVYNGTADLYVYFYSRAIELLQRGGRTSYIVTNKWLRAGYGEALRQHLANSAHVEQIIDFGHAPIFPEADVFPCIALLRKPDIGGLENGELRTEIALFPREQLGRITIPDFLQANAYAVPTRRFGAEPWSLEPPEVEALMDRICDAGVPLRDFIGASPLYGIKTGLNEAFLIDTPTRDRLVHADPKSAEIIKPYLRGQDIERWVPEWAGLWMIFARRGIDIDAYPAVKKHLEQFREQLAPKPKEWKGGPWKGRKAGSYEWYELQDAVDYYKAFEQPKIVYQVIQFHPQYCVDRDGNFTNDKCFFIPASARWIAAVLNSPLMWWHNWRYLPHMKDEALNPAGFRMEQLPIAAPSDQIRAEAEPAVERLIGLTREQRETAGELLEWLRVEWGVATPGRKLEAFADLDSDAFLAEVKKRRGRSAGSLSPKAVAALGKEFGEYAPRVRAIAAVAAQLERRLAALVERAYGFTPEDVELMWRTAPPRMPGAHRPGE